MNKYIYVGLAIIIISLIVTLIKEGSKVIIKIALILAGVTAIYMILTGKAYVLLDGVQALYTILMVALSKIKELQGM